MLSRASWSCNYKDLQGLGQMQNQLKQRAQFLENSRYGIELRTLKP
jgi:hypothetical protein